MAEKPRTGHIAALQAAREGVSTSIIEAGTMLGGTMTAGGVYMPNHFFNKNGPVVQGIAWELYCKSKEVQGIKHGVPSREFDSKDIVALTMEHGAAPV